MIDKRKSSLLLSISLTALLISGCGIDNTDENQIGASQLIKVVPLFDIDSTNMQDTVTALKPGSPAFGVKGFKMLYSTHNDKGEKITVSGLVTIPVPSQTILTAMPDYSMSIVSDQHGTIFPDFEAPSTAATLTGKPYAAGTLFSAVAGFVTIQPDYIGFGETKGTAHPYLLEESSANVVVDMIKATLAFGNQQNLPLNGQVYLTGYSEGGYVTMAAAKEIEANQPNITLKGVAPMAGPYDLNLTGMGVLSVAQMQRPDFIGGIINAYASNYDYNISTIVNAPYDTVLPTLYDGVNTATEIQAALTTEVASFIQPAYRGDFLQNPNNPLRAEFINNSVDDYTPTSTTQLYYCSGDTVINPLLAQNAAAKMGITAIDINASLDHAECATPAYGAVAAWFSELRSN